MRKRMYIHERLPYFINDGRIGVEPDDVSTAIRLYDDYFLDGTIATLLEEHNITLDIRISFNRLGASAYIIRVNSEYVVLELHPCIWEYETIPRWPDGDDALLRYQYVIECSCVRLILALSSNDDYQDMDIRELSLNLFSHDGEMVNVEAPVPDELCGMYVNWSNSCYIDSLLMILLFSSSDYYRSRIFRVSPSQLKYLSWKSSQLKLSLDERDDMAQVYKQICPASTDVITERQTRIIALRIREELLKDYSRMLGNHPIRCERVRELIRNCLPQIYNRGWVSYNAPEVYSLITDLFPMLKMKNVNVRYIGDDNSRYRETKLEQTSLFQMWDYIHIPSDGMDIIWGNINVEVLVFQNGMNPAVRLYNSIGDEEVLGYDSKITVVRKHRLFGEYIIDDRYRLFGVVMNCGTRPSVRSSIGGGHYISYFRASFDTDNWYYYDDMDYRRYKKIPSLPSKVFVDGDSCRPELLFYERIAESHR